MTARNWSDEETELLKGLDGQGVSCETMAVLLDKTMNAVKAKLATVRGRTYRTYSKALAPGRARFDPGFTAPDPVISNDAKHLQSILDAHRAGFPVCGRS